MLSARSKAGEAAWRDIYITEEEKRKINVFNEAGELLAHWGEPGSAPGQFKSFVHSLWLDSHGNLDVTEVL
jgi:hypothetical protein